MNVVIASSPNSPNRNVPTPNTTSPTTIAVENPAILDRVVENDHHTEKLSQMSPAN